MSNFFVFSKQIKRHLKKYTHSQIEFTKTGVAVRAYAFSLNMPKCFLRYYDLSKINYVVTTGDKAHVVFEVDQSWLAKTGISIDEIQAFVTGATKKCPIDIPKYNTHSFDKPTIAPTITPTIPLDDSSCLLFKHGYMLTAKDDGLDWFIPNDTPLPVDIGFMSKFKCEDNLKKFLDIISIDSNGVATFVTKDVAAKLGVSNVTILRYLDNLEQGGYVKRIVGGIYDNPAQVPSDKLHFTKFKFTKYLP